MKYFLAFALLAAAEAEMPSEPPPLVTADAAGFNVPETCSFVYGDPHIFTFDGLAANCHGDGDYVLSKSRDPTNDFEIQGRFMAATQEIAQEHFDEKGWWLGTAAKALVINTGVEGEPIIEIDADVPNPEGHWNGCQMKYRINGEEVDLSAADMELADGAVTFERRHADEPSLWNDSTVRNYYRNFYFKKSGVFVQVTRKYWWKLGCFMNHRICVPDEIKDKGIVGVLGNANGNQDDEYITRFGEIETGKMNWLQKNEFCKENWCVPDESESLFANFNEEAGCKIRTDNDLEEMVNNVSDEIKEGCDNDLDCITDTIVSGDLKLGQRTLNEKIKKDEFVQVDPDEIDETEDDTCTTPEGKTVDCETFDWEFTCEKVGEYDFGYAMEGCDAHADGPFQSLTLTDASPTCNVGNYFMGAFDISCSGDEKEATITPSVDVVVKLSGSSTGTLYSELTAGDAYTLTTGQGDKKEVIQNIEFCFKCPTAVVDNSLVKCAADVHTCPDGTELKRDADDHCKFPECPAPPCDRMKEDMKCKYGAGSRVFKTDNTDLAGCQKTCEDTADCNFYSFAEEGGNAGVCMGCKSDYDAQGASGFDFYPVECRAAQSDTEPKQVEEDDDRGGCKDMRENTKCPYQHQHRLHRLEDQSIESCQKKCEETDTCAYYSFAEEGQYAGVCMGCTNDAAKQAHTGFNLYAVECLGDRQLKEEPEQKKAPEPEKDPKTACDHMQVNKKCKYGAGSRIFKTENTDLAGCQKECDGTDGCNYYSFAEEGQYAGICMGCMSADDAQVHAPFVFYPVACNSAQTAQEPEEVDDDSRGGCKDMRVNTKCPYKHSDRLHRLEDQTIESCQKKCEETDTCAYYSFAKPGVGNGYEGVCMGCTDDVAKEAHTGFNLYAVECLGDRQLTEEPEQKKAPEPEKDPKTACDHMQLNKKCKHGAGSRIFKTENTDLEGCQKECADSDDCNYYSFAEEGQYAGICMGCSSADDAEVHAPFVFYPVACNAAESDTEPKEVDDDSRGGCKDMRVNTKCPYKHEDRLHRLEDQTIESCQRKCEETDTCAYYSFAKPGVGNGFEGVCMGCNDDVAKEAHTGFNLYAVSCVGDKEKEDPKLAPPKDNVPKKRTVDDDDKKKASGSGDPHFKTWTGEKFDYHGECDLVLVDNPSFHNGLGLRVHIRTTQVKYFSFIEQVAVQIGEDVLEFDNDVENFLVNGEKVGENQQHHKTTLSGFVVRRDPKALSIRLHDEGKVSRQTHTVTKIDLHTRKNGFPAVIMDGGVTDMFRGSLGLLGEWETGRKLGRDGKTEFEVDPEDAENFALEWQVNEQDPTLFKTSRFPQFPQTCTPAKKMVQNRLGMDKAKQEAEEACGHWEEDMDDCIFDVMATRDVLVAEEGHIVHIA